jgi:hypothetical protein
MWILKKSVVEVWIEFDKFGAKKLVNRIKKSWCPQEDRFMAS